MSESPGCAVVRLLDLDCAIRKGARGRLRYPKLSKPDHYECVNRHQVINYQHMEGESVIGRIIKAIALTCLALALAKPAPAYILVAVSPGGEVCSTPNCDSSQSRLLNDTGPELIQSLGYTPLTPEPGTPSPGFYPQSYGTAKVDLANGTIGAQAIGGAFYSTAFAEGQIDAPLYLTSTCGTGVCTPPGTPITITAYLNGLYNVPLSANSPAGTLASIQASIDVTGATQPVDFLLNLHAGDIGGFNNYAFPITFSAVFGQPLILSADLLLEAGYGANLDFFSTTTFGIDLPADVTLTSPSTFAGPENLVPEPNAGSILALACLALPLLRIRKRAYRALASGTWVRGTQNR